MCDFFIRQKRVFGVFACRLIQAFFSFFNLCLTFLIEKHPSLYSACPVLCFSFPMMPFFTIYTPTRIGRFCHFRNCALLGETGTFAEFAIVPYWERQAHLLNLLLCLTGETGTFAEFAIVPYSVRLLFAKSARKGIDKSLRAYYCTN